MSYSLWSHEPQKARPPCPSPTPGVFFSKYKTFLLPISCHTLLYFSFPGGSVVKNLPTRAGDLCLIPGLGRSPGEEMATHSSILAWRISWTEEPCGLMSIGSQKSQTWLSDWAHTRTLVNIQVWKAQHQIQWNGSLWGAPLKLSHRWCALQPSGTEEEESAACKR